MGKYKVVSTQDWPFEKLARYTPQITAAMKQLAEKFPADVTVRDLALELFKGDRLMWLILDRDDEFVSFCCTSIATTPAGKKIVTLSSHAGAAGLDCVDDMCSTIEAYAWEQGADYCAAEGRRGWLRELAKHNYREYAVVLRKERPVSLTGGDHLQN